MFPLGFKHAQCNNVATLITKYSCKKKKWSGEDFMCQLHEAILKDLLLMQFFLHVLT